MQTDYHNYVAQQHNMLQHGTAYQTLQPVVHQQPIHQAYYSYGQSINEYQIRPQSRPKSGMKGLVGLQRQHSDNSPVIQPQRQNLPVKNVQPFVGTLNQKPQGTFYGTTAGRQPTRIDLAATQSKQHPLQNSGPACSNNRPANQDIVPSSVFYHSQRNQKNEQVSEAYYQEGQSTATSSSIIKGGNAICFNVPNNIFQCFDSPAENKTNKGLTGQATYGSRLPTAQTPQITYGGAQQMYNKIITERPQGNYIQARPLSDYNTNVIKGNSFSDWCDEGWDEPLGTPQKQKSYIQPPKPTRQASLPHLPQAHRIQPAGFSQPFLPSSPTHQASFSYAPFHQHHTPLNHLLPPFKSVSSKLKTQNSLVSGGSFIDHLKSDSLISGYTSMESEQGMSTLEKIIEYIDILDMFLKNITQSQQNYSSILAKNSQGLANFYLFKLCCRQKQRLELSLRGGHNIFQDIDFIEISNFELDHFRRDPQNYEVFQLIGEENQQLAEYITQALDVYKRKFRIFPKANTNLWEDFRYEMCYYINNEVNFIEECLHDRSITTHDKVQLRRRQAFLYESYFLSQFFGGQFLKYYEDFNEIKDLRKYIKSHKTAFNKLISERISFRK